MAPILVLYAYAYHILEEAYKNGRESMTENHLMFELAEMLDMEEDKVEGEIEIMKVGKISGNMPIFDGGYVYLPWVYFLRKKALEMLKGNEAVKVSLPGNSNGNEGDVNDGKIHELLSHKYTILTGGPGTGKTTLLERIAGIIPNTQLSALTGKAAQRLGEDARTVHSLLGFGPRGFSKKELDCNLLIVDEASMMNWRTLHAVLLASPRIIFSGDPEQLPPVGGESVFKKMIETLPVVKLDKTWRFKNGLCVETIKKETEKEVFVALSNLLTALKHKDFQVITPIHGGLLGTRYLNTYIQSSFNPSSVILDNLRYKDRVIVTRNIYLDGELIAANGQVGIVEGVDTVEGSIYVCVSFQRNGRVLVDRKDLELAYALTVHKYQGSECDYVVFIIPDRKKVREDFITDEMMLVGKTRGRMKTYVLEATGG
jgi:ATP-dependent exoDNAse (exonuclease V) alpha subunit